VCCGRKVTFLFPQQLRQAASRKQSIMHEKVSELFPIPPDEIEEACRHLINVYRFIGAVKHSKALFK
jgi:hypothetical protein